MTQDEYNKLMDGYISFLGRGNRIGTTIEERFWEKVNKQGVNDCWNWLARPYTKGYGGFYFEGKSRRAHRVSWILHNGKIPDRLFVLHTCDNKSCVNPAHLYLGNASDNAYDRVRRGKDGSMRGEEHYRAKLTVNDVRIIRKEYSTGLYTQRELGRKHGLRQQHICKIVNRRIWKSVPKG